MKKNYVVWYDNGETYEDNYQDIDCIFSSKEAAEEYLDKHFLREDRHSYNGDVTYWVNHPFVCHMGHTDAFSCEDCPKNSLSDNYDGTKFTNESNEETGECPDYYSILDNDYDNSSRTIITQNIFESASEYETYMEEKRNKNKG